VKTRCLNPLADNVRLGASQTSGSAIGKSASPLRADIVSKVDHFRKGPKPDSRSPFEFRCKASGTKLQLRLSRAVTDTKKATTWVAFLFYF